MKPHKWFYYKVLNFIVLWKDVSKDLSLTKV